MSTERAVGAPEEEGGAGSGDEGRDGQGPGLGPAKPPPEAEEAGALFDRYA